jgi:hypothetical protein
MSSRLISLFLARVLIGSVLIGSVLIGLVVPATGSATPSPPTPSSSPPALGTQISALITSTTNEWALHQTPEGWLIDPVLGRATSSYGLAMTGQSMVALGVSENDAALVEDGLRAELAEVAQPDGGGFELLALSEAFAWNDQHLASMPAWVAARGTIASFITSHAPLVSDAGPCYTDDRCYDNLKLVAAIAELSLLQTGLPDPTLGSPAAIRAKALALLAQAAKNAGSDAQRVGDSPFHNAGILSDPGRDPLAYHALSTLMLGQAVQSLGASAPAAVIAAFSRCARALIALMAPDGDVAYIGRGQGQVWTVAASIDALSIAALMTHSATWKGRYLAGAALELSRLHRLYPPRGWGLPLVPRLAGDEAGQAPNVQAPSQTPNYLGIDGYANTVQYNGLSLWALSEAAHLLSLIPSTVYQALPSTEKGAFLDPSHTRFATVTNGNLWYAVHGADSDHADARYGFGLISVERNTAQGWRAVLPYPPLTSSLTSTPNTGGPTSICGGRRNGQGGGRGNGRTGGRKDELTGRTLYPLKTRIAASANGEVTIHAGWSATKGKAPSSKLDTTWSYRPTSSGDGIALSFHTRARCAYQFPIWYQANSEIKESKTGLTITEPKGNGGGLTITEPHGSSPSGPSQSYDFNTKVAFRISSFPVSSESYHSAYAENLGSIIITIPPTSHPRNIIYLTSFSGD